MLSTMLYQNSFYNETYCTGSVVLQRSFHGGAVNLIQSILVGEFNKS